MELKETQQRGKGFWKFNNSLLHDIEYVQLIKKITLNIKNECPMENKNTLWEYTKCKIRTKTITFSSKKAKERNEKQKALESKLKILEEQLHFDNKIITEYNKKLLLSKSMLMRHHCCKIL